MMDFFSQHWTLAIDWVSLHAVTPVVNALNIAEAAADPLLAVVLVGLGATSLSMAPTALADVRASLLHYDLADAQRIAEAALAADDAASARAAAQAAAETAA